MCVLLTPVAKFELYSPFLTRRRRDTSENYPPGGDGFGGITLACNVKNKEGADSGIELVKKAGGVIVKESQDAFWSGYHAYFADPDGYYWEVAWGGGGFKFNEDGLLKFN